MKSVLRLLLPVFLLVSPGCSQEPESFGSDPAAAVSLIRRTYRADEWNPQSSTIHTAEYFPTSSRRFLIVTFHRREGGTSKPYLYEGVPLNLWKEWRDAPSAGSWYNANLKGRFQFRPR